MTEYADLIPLRRVETTTDRMRHATTGYGDCTSCGEASATATYRQALNERAEALEARDVLAAQLGDARRIIAAIRAAAEDLDRALAGRLPSLPDVRAAVEQLDRALAHNSTATPDA